MGVGVARSACWTYVTWYHDLSTTDWATWLPGMPIQPGSVGVFGALVPAETGEVIERALRDLRGTA